MALSFSSAVITMSSLVTIYQPSIIHAADSPTPIACEQALLIGHRGTNVGVARSNSLAAFQKAVADGAEMIELDIQRTKPVNGSGTWIVWHDSTIQGKKITSYTYSQLKAIQPDLMTIREAFAYISTTGLRMEVEVKPANTSTGSFKYFAGLVSQYNMQAKFQLSSFNITNLTRAKSYGMRTVYLSSKAVSPATVKLYADIVHLNKNLVTTKTLVDNFHTAGISVYVYTVNTATDWDRYLGYGVDGVTTDTAINYNSYCVARQT